MAAKFSVDKGKPIYISMFLGESFSNDQSLFTPSQHAQMNNVPYVEAISHVLWPVMISRLDALCAVGILVQFMQNLGWAHWKAIKRVIGYLWLMFGGINTNLEGFSDADWASQPYCRSISGYAFLMGKGVVTL